jgi:hypothetical protein
MALADTEYSPSLTPMAKLCTYNYGEWGRMSFIFWSAGLPTAGLSVALNGPSFLQLYSVENTDMQLLTKNEETLLELLELMSSCLWLQK